MNGQLLQGDQIIKVNNTDLSNSTQVRRIQSHIQTNGFNFVGCSSSRPENSLWKHSTYCAPAEDCDKTKLGKRHVEIKNMSNQRVTSNNLSYKSCDNYAKFGGKRANCPVFPSMSSPGGSTILQGNTQLGQSGAQGYRFQKSQLPSSPLLK